MRPDDPAPPLVAEFPTLAEGPDNLLSRVPGVVFRYRGTFERGRMVFVNSAIEHLLGYSPEEVYAHKVENMLLPWLTPHPDLGKNYVGHLRDRYTCGSPMSVINRAIGKDGSGKWILLRARPIQEHPNGEFTLEGASTDVSELIDEKTRLLAALERKYVADVDADLTGAERILIVDDKVDVADTLSDGLAKFGYETAPVYCPMEAIALVTEHPQAWDVVIANCEMRNLNGVAFLETVRAVRPDVMTILCSELSRTAAEGLIASGRIDAHAEKPVAATPIASRVRQLMSYRRQRV
jgi:PAS domain S-box-containing protein